MAEHPLGPAAHRGPFENLTYLSVALPISEQEYRDRTVAPTTAERAEMDRRAAEREASEMARRERYATLTGLSRGTVRLVFDLHAPAGQFGSWWTCGSCYDGGNMGDHEDWPCPTARILLGEPS